MAARLNRMHSDKVLERIKLSQLVNRLQDNALGSLKAAKTGELIEMTPSQIDCAKFLLERKLARAVAPQNINLTGQLDITERILASRKRTGE